MAASILDLGADLLLMILAALDEQALLRVGAACRTLVPCASSASLWHVALLRFFDGELPPPLAKCAQPRQVLREQVLAGKHLTELEREQKRFQIAEKPSTFRQCEWMRDLDVKVAEVQIAAGERLARPGRPYYGCSGGAYSTRTWTYGAWTKTVCSNCVASSYAGISREETRLTVWHFNGAHDEGRMTEEAAKPSLAISECDYGPLAEWKDGKLAALADQAGRPHLAHRLRQENAAHTLKGLYKSDDPDVNVQNSKRVEPTLEQLSLPKLLCGVYGGLFQPHEVPTSIGTIYALDCIDGTCINDYSGM